MNGLVQFPIDAIELLAPVDDVRIPLDAELRERFIVREHLKDGRLNVHLLPVDPMFAVGDELDVALGLSDKAMPEALYTAPIRIRIVPERVQDDDADTSRQRPNETQKESGAGMGSDAAPTHGLPHFALLTRDGRTVADVDTEKWPDGFTEHDGGEVTDLGDGEMLYKINYDNAYHLRYRSTQRSSVAREVVTKKFVLGMRILLLGYEHALRSLRDKSDDPAGLGEFTDDFRRMAACGAASTVLALAENLPRIVDSSSLAAEDAD